MGTKEQNLEFREDLLKRIADEEAFIARLRSGGIRYSRRVGDGDWEDVTDAQIDRSEQNIATYQAALRLTD